MKSKISYEFIKNVLNNFSKLLNSKESREQKKKKKKKKKKKLLHMIISKLTINELREVDSIHLTINDKLVEYISKEEGVSIKDYWGIIKQMIWLVCKIKE